MRTSISSKIFAAVACAPLLSAISAFGQTASAPALPYGAANVLKLAQANVGEETIVAYIEKSGQGFGNLGANEIIYLREQGVSDRAITTMLTQEKKTRDAAVAESIVQQSVVAATPAPAPAPVVAAPQYQQTYVAPPVTYVQAAPAPLIVMRDSSPRLVDYGIYPRYGYGCYPSYGYRSYGCAYPNLSFSVGFSGRYGGIGFHSGGFRGGYCR